MRNLKDLLLGEILPASIAEDRQVQAGAAALSPELQSVSLATREAYILSRIDELPEVVVDLLAWQFHVDFYEPLSLSVEAKRRLVKNSIPWHRKKGTPWAVRRLLGDLGFDSEIREWFEYEGTPYTAKLKVWVGEEFDLSSETRDLAVRAFNVAKSYRTGLAGLILGVWMEDFLGEPLDGDGTDVTGPSGMGKLAIGLPFFEVYPWGGLRYGFFDYGDLLRYGSFSFGESWGRYGYGTPGTPVYGEGMPDLLETLTVRFPGMTEIYRVPSLYTEVRYGDFRYGSSEGPHDYGGHIEIRRPLVYGKFSYGDGCPRYGEARYGEFAYGGGVAYGGKITREAL